MKGLFFIVLICFNILTANSQIIKGRLKDQYGMPDTLAIIQQTNGDCFIGETHPNDKGEFQITLNGPCENFSFTIYSKGFYEMKIYDIRAIDNTDIGTIPMYQKSFVDSLITKKSKVDHLTIKYPTLFIEEKKFKNDIIGKMFKSEKDNYAIDYLFISYK